jgi:transposase
MDGMSQDIRDAEVIRRLAEAEQRLMLEIRERERLDQQLRTLTQRIKDLLGSR